MSSFIRQVLDFVPKQALILLSSEVLRPEDLKEFKTDRFTYHDQPASQGDILCCINQVLAPGQAPPARDRLDMKKFEVPVSKKSLNILMAEDVDLNQKVAKCMLNKLEHHLIIVSKGREAVEAVEARKFDLVLMDIQMPILDGVAATGPIRAREIRSGSVQHLPIVAMTAHAMNGDRENYLASGMDSYISKPIRLTELASVINENN